MTAGWLVVKMKLRANICLVRFVMS